MQWKHTACRGSGAYPGSRTHWQMHCPDRARQMPRHFPRNAHQRSAPLYLNVLRDARLLCRCTACPTSVLAHHAEPLVGV
eukprot:12833296-Alexandrium_andersonii.AAC.1